MDVEISIDFTESVRLTVPVKVIFKAREENNDVIHVIKQICHQ